MYRRIFFGIALLVVLALGAAAIGGVAYRAGMTQGLADSGKLVAPQIAAPYGYHGGPMFFHHPFGFGLLGLLFPLLGIFLVFSLVRGIFWRGPWGWRGHGMHMAGKHGPWGNGLPPMFEEWHKQAHGQTSPPAEPTQP